jgi:hypothetical protein
MTNRELRCWQRLVALAYAESEHHLVAGFTNALTRVIPASFFQSMTRKSAAAAIPFLDGLPALEHPGLADEARRIQPELRILLRYVAGATTLVQKKLAKQVLDDHPMPEMKWMSMPTALRGKIRRPLADFRAIQDDKGVVYLHPRTERSEKPVGWYLTRDLREPLTQFCGFIREELDKHRGRRPLRLCGLLSCGKVFLRRGKVAFCSPRCRYKQKQMPRGEMRAYMTGRAAKQLLASGGVKAVRARIEQIERGNSPPGKKRRLLRAYRKVLPQ